MLYWLLYQELGINLFRYPSVRVLIAAALSLLLSIWLGPVFIARLRQMSIGQEVRDDGPKEHKRTKQGTPTMGGTLILFCASVPTLLFADLTSGYICFVLVVFWGYGWIGFVDDFRKVKRRNSKGLAGRYKLIWQAVIGGVALGCLFLFTPYTTNLALPFIKPETFNPDLGFFYIPFALLVLMGTSNAVNLTDGLDGLAIVPTVISAFVFLGLAYAAGTTLSGFNLAEYLRIQPTPGTAELAVFCASICGGGLGFLWFNAHPAEVFMGDVGSLSLGGALGAMAVATKNELVSAIIHGVFLAEAVSVILQVASFKLRGGKRIFKMAPLHHHFELSGWPEPKVIVRFWIVSVLLALCGIATLKLR
jgi:phospho-N-acetylmuramoyl-pentapeptide-transferase